MQTSIEKTYDARRFEHMEKLVSGIYPDLSEGQVRHACNLVSNELRRLHDDIYLVELSGDGKFPDVHGYYSYRDIDVSGKRIFMRITVD